MTKRKKNSQKRRPPSALNEAGPPARPSARPAFDITIATVSDGKSQDEVALVKAALLYGDRVVLLSPSTEMVIGAASLTQLRPAQQLEVFATMMEALNPDASATLRAVVRKRHRTPSEIVWLRSMQLEAKRLMEGELINSLDDFAEKVGVSALVPAMEAGLVTIKPLLQAEGDDMFDRLIEEVARLLNDPSAYPLFDRNVGAVASAGLAEGQFTLHDRTSRHGKRAGLADSLFGYLPTFPQATVEQVLELREDITASRIRFREAISTLSEEFTSESFDEDFSAEVQDAWVEHVAPALLDIEVAIAESHVRRTIARAFTTNETVAGGLLGVAATAVADPGSALAAIGGIAGASGAASAKAFWDGVAKRREAQKNGFFLLHQTNETLARSA